MAGGEQRSVRLQTGSQCAGTHLTFISAAVSLVLWEAPEVGGEMRLTGQVHTCACTHTACTPAGAQRFGHRVPSPPEAPPCLCCL